MSVSVQSQMDEPAREALLLLPGLLCDAMLWADQVRDLADIATPTVANLTLDNSVGAMAERALTVAPERFALAALSMGGYVAFEILRRAPERVTRLALLATSAAPDDPRRAAMRRGAMASLKLGRFVGVSNRMLPQLIHPDRIATPIGAAVRAMAERVGGEAFLRQQRAILDRPDSRPMLAAITVPTMIVVGEQDALTPPSEARALNDAIPGSTLHLLPECGHLPPMERSEDTSRLLREWLIISNPGT